MFRIHKNQTSISQKTKYAILNFLITLFALFSNIQPSHAKDIYTMWLAVLTNGVHYGTAVEYWNDNSGTVVISRIHRIYPGWVYGGDASSIQRVIEFKFANSIIKVGIETIGEAAFKNSSQNSILSLPNFITSIGRSAFEGCNIKSIVLPEAITTIEPQTFKDCYDLESFFFPKSLIEIKNKAFNNCTHLASLILPPSTQLVANDAFLGCTQLKKVAYPENCNNPFSEGVGVCYDPTDIVIVDNEWVFDSNYESVYFAPISLCGEYSVQSSIKHIGDMAFRHCSDLTEIHLSDITETIGKGAFSECSSLTSITITNSVKSIEESTFEGCTALSEVKIGDNVERIGKNAFKGCKSLKSITIPSSVKYIDAEAFDGCIALSEVILPNSVKTIGSRAFFNCSKLNSVVISGDINEFGDNIWQGCENIKDIYYLSTNPVSASINIFDDIIYETAELHTDESITKRVSTICPWGAFENINGVIEPRYTLSYKFSGTVAILTGFNSFRCINNLVIPSEIQVNGKTFAVTEISDKALQGSDLFKYVYIPETITTIAPDAFKGCSNLVQVDYNAQNLVNYSSAAFATCPNLKIINIGDAVSEIPKSLFSSTSAEIINISDNVITINDFAFFNCNRVKDITIGKSVETIGPDAFSIHVGVSTPYRNINFNPVRLKKYANAFNNCAIGTIRFGEEVEKCPKNTLRECRPSVIECFNPFPPSMGDYSLESADKATCKLLVPVGSKTDYSYAYIWRQFNNISDELTGIEDLTADVDLDDSTPVTAYTLTGQKVYSGLRSEMSLKPGMYIIVQGRKTSKLAIK